MKAEFDKEIDALLRRRSRAAGRGAPPPRADARATSHLDADELSAFAEHALPEAARLAAVSHLADCGECRGAVVTLSRAAGEPTKRAAVPAPVDPSEAVPAGGWLVALFSPRLLRFVAPALAVCLVGAVAFVLLRTRRDAGFVAQHAPAVETGPLGRAPAAGPSANVNANAGIMDEATANVAAAEPSTAETSPAEQERRETPGSNAESEAPDGSDERDVLLRRPPAETAAREDAPPPAPAAVTEAVTVASAPSPQPAARDAAHEKAGESRRAEADEVARNAEGPQPQERNAQLGNLNNVQQQSPDGSRQRSANNTFGGGARSAPAAPQREPERSGRSITGPRARREAPKEDESADAGAERTAAGHRFRREGNAWVDVNYRPSMAMTGVRRGTEAFRALVADIPELGRIAEQLSGEVITVVRGRAYRIR